MTKTTPRDRPSTAIGRDTNRLQRQQDPPSTPQGKWAKGPPTAVTPMAKMAKPRFSNPYMIQKSEPERDRMMFPGKLIKIMNEYMTILESQKGTRNATWHKWLKSGLNESLTVYQLAKIVDIQTKRTRLFCISAYICLNNYQNWTGIAHYLPYPAITNRSAIILKL